MNAREPVTFDAFVEAAWNDHGDLAQDVAARLAASLALIESSEQIAPYARLITHVYGEHLGQWDAGVALLESLRRLPAFADSSPAATGAVIRGIATLRYIGGDPKELDTLSLEDRVSVLATASSAFAGRDSLPQAIAAYEDALKIAGDAFPEKSPVNRALAIGGNNLAATLEEKTERTDPETVAMVDAAKAALKYWKLAGTWLEEERAEYRLTRSQLKAGDAEAAMRSARRCIDVCERNAAPAFERFFAHSALALSLRSAGDAAAFNLARRAAYGWLDKVPVDERPSCEAERLELA